MIDVRRYAVVTGAYWGFTLTDGALRMLVLLHFHDLGYSTVDLAFLFLLYEFCGILTNLFVDEHGSLRGLCSVQSPLESHPRIVETRTSRSDRVHSYDAKR